MLLLCNSQPWEKKSGDPDFDVTMGCSDGVDTGKLLEIFILTNLSSIIDKYSIGLQSDDDLGIFEKLSWSKIV